MEGSEIQFVDVGNDFDDAETNLLAFVTQRSGLARTGLQLGDARRGRIELTLEAGRLVKGLRPICAKAVDQTDQLADFFFQAVNRLQVCRSGHRVFYSCFAR